jgi:hypothetical protein
MPTLNIMPGILINDVLIEEFATSSSTIFGGNWAAAMEL